jgi:hypothetical protein
MFSRHLRSRSVCGSSNDLYWGEDTAEMKPAELILPTNSLPLIWELCTLKFTLFHHKLSTLAIDLHPETDGSPCDSPHLYQISFLITPLHPRQSRPSTGACTLCTFISVEVTFPVTLLLARAIYVG